MTSLLTKTKLFFKFALRDAECGLHSGYKPCCIFCFSVLDNLSILDKRRFYIWRRSYNLVVQKLLNKHFKYIPCPLCVWFNPIRTIKCLRQDCSKHPFDYVSDEEFSLFSKIKDLQPIGDRFVNLEILMNWIIPPGGVRYFV